MGLFSGRNPKVVFEEADELTAELKHVAYQRSCGGLIFSVCSVFDWVYGKKHYEFISKHHCMMWLFMRAKERLALKKAVAVSMGGKVLDA